MLNKEQVCPDHFRSIGRCSNDNFFCGPALPLAGDKFYFYSNDPPKGCPAMISYGNLFTCSCPERKEFYRKYRY